MGEPQTSARPITALILCGGRGSRMGGVDKPLQSFHGRPLVGHVLDRIRPQVQGRVLISANRHLPAYREFGHPVLADSLSDFQGPLAGLLAGLAHVNGPAMTATPGDAWLLCVSGDSPWLPVDLVDRLWQGVGGVSGRNDCAMALGREAPGEPLRSQPLASLVHTRHHRALAQALASGERRVEAWLRSLPLAEVPFDQPQDAFAFANINDRSQLERPEPAP
ncbi:molybdopterin-guanine dinucleotide biosynthesis protein A [Roseateles sp. YR242]|uniref:molybdenum cofactor guanylyltransferase MobA n=1 Tax=Roseateles sp. YR242 TaxID=1855305 RepID=UPI0008BC174D|nr:molybdenum cofactor guanylyltransferase MobA [Roseateles sp. YR242]SEK32685.1 molybdopterin-guanine dinucleotide biosynthesis protein A [Roseateles sp. YR242]